MTGPVPPRDPDPFAGLTDEQVLARATAALAKVTGYPVGSVERSVQWGLYDAAKAELDRRLLGHVLRQLGERGGAGQA